MKIRKHMIWAAALAMTLSFGGAMTSLAATGKISKVSLRVDSELKPGGELGDASVDYSNSGYQSASENGVMISVDGSANYTITDLEWVTKETKVLHVGYQPVIKVTLKAEDADEYPFKSSTSVTVRGDGTYKSKDRNGDEELVVRITIDPIEGQFAEPDDAYWKDNTKGTARWESPDDDDYDSGTYEVVLRRGSTKVHTVETTGHSYDFYPYMTKAGTYTFRVRTIGNSEKQKEYGDPSDWVESDELYISKDEVSDGTGQNTNTGSTPTGNGNQRVGWQLINGYWYYYYPDGSYQKDSWLKVNGAWYLFQSDGKMLTGWQNRNNQTYFLTDSGAMATGWVKGGQYWYYMNPTQDSFEGAMLSNRWANINGKVYYLRADGVMAEGWQEIDGSWYYFYPGSGERAVNTYIGTFYVNGDGVWVR